jgi:hypothetical protein
LLREPTENVKPRRQLRRLIAKSSAIHSITIAQKFLVPMIDHERAVSALVRLREIPITREILLRVP